MSHSDSALRIVLVSIGHSPSLATRNLRRYCLAHEDVRQRVEFTLIDRDLREFTRSHTRSKQQLSFATPADAILSSMSKLRPAIVAFSCYLWNTELSIRLGIQIKALIPGVQLVLGGPDVGARARTLLERNPELDVIVDGDGEVPFLELVRCHLAGHPNCLENVPQVSYRAGQDLRTSAAPHRATDLALLRTVFDDLPTVDELQRWGSPYIMYETMRGCPYPCSFCMYGTTPMGRKDPAVVVDELAAILSLGLDVELIDPTFTTYSKHAKEVLRGLAERTYSGTLWFEAYPDSIDEELIDLLKRTNVYAVELGFQTLSSEGLKAVNRPQSLTRFERAVSLLRAAGIFFWVDVIYGLPNTAPADFFASVDYLTALGVPTIDIYRLLGLPGTPMMRDLKSFDLVFSSTPPYELLSSRTYSIDDLLSCSTFAETYNYLRAHMDRELLHRFAGIAGSLSGLIRHVMKSGVVLDEENTPEINAVLAGLMRRPDAKERTSR